MDKNVSSVPPRLWKCDLNFIKHSIASEFETGFDSGTSMISSVSTVLGV